VAYGDATYIEAENKDYFEIFLYIRSDADGTFKQV